MDLFDLFLFVLEVYTSLLIQINKKTPIINLVNRLISTGCFRSV